MPTIVDFGEELGQVDFGELTQDQLRARPDLVMQVRQRLIQQRQAANADQPVPDMVRDEAYARGRIGSAGQSLMKQGGVSVGESTSWLARLSDAASTAFAGMDPSGTGLAAPTMEVAQEVEAERIRKAARTPLEREAEIQADPIYKAGQYLKGGAAEAFQPNPAYQGEFFADTIASSAGGMVPTFAASAIGGPVLAALQYGSSAGQAAAEEAIALGRPDLAQTAAMVNAPIGAVTEAVLGPAANFGKYFQRAATRGVARTLLGGAIRESAQEGLEQVGSNFAARGIGYDPDRPLLQGVPESMGAGFILGGAIGGGVGAAGKYADRRRAAAELEREFQTAELQRQNNAALEAGLNIAYQSRSALSQVDAQMAQTPVENPAQAQAVFARGLAEKLRIATDYVEASRNVAPPAPAPIPQVAIPAAPAAPVIPEAAIPPIAAPSAAPVIPAAVPAPIPAPAPVQRQAAINQQARRSGVESGLVTQQGQEVARLAPGVGPETSTGISQIEAAGDITPFDEYLRKAPPLGLNIPSEIQSVYSTANEVAQRYLSGADVDADLLGQLDSIAPTLVDQIDNRIRSGMQAGAASSQLEPLLQVSERLGQYLNERRNDQAFSQLAEEGRYQAWLQSKAKPEAPAPTIQAPPQPAASPAVSPRKPSRGKAPVAARVAAQPAPAAQAPAPAQPLPQRAPLQASDVANVAVTPVQLPATSPLAQPPANIPQPTPSDAVQISQPSQGVLGDQAPQPEVQVELPGVGQQDAQVRAAIEEVSPEATLVDPRLKTLGLDRLMERLAKAKQALIKLVTAPFKGKARTPAQLAKISAAAVRQIQFELEEHRRGLEGKSNDDLLAELVELVPNTAGTNVRSRISYLRAVQVMQALIDNGLPIQAIGERIVPDGGAAAINFIQRAVTQVTARKVAKEEKAAPKKAEQNRQWWRQDPAFLDLDNLTPAESARVDWDNGNQPEGVEPPPETNKTKLLKFTREVQDFIGNGANGAINDMRGPGMDKFRDRIYDLVMGEAVSDYKEQTANGGQWDIGRGWSLVIGARSTLSKAASNIRETSSYKEIRKNVSSDVSQGEKEDKTWTSNIPESGKQPNVVAGTENTTEQLEESKAQNEEAKSIVDQLAADGANKRDMILLKALAEKQRAEDATDSVKQEYYEEEYENTIEIHAIRPAELNSQKIKDLFAKYGERLGTYLQSRGSISVPIEQSQVQAAIASAFGSVPQNVTIIEDPNHVLPDGRSGEDVGAYVDISTGEIVVNAAFIDSDMRAVEAVVEEMVHIVFRDAKVQQQWARVLQQVTQADIQAKVDAGYSADQAREEAAVEKVLEYMRENSKGGTIGQFIETLWARLKEVFSLSNQYDKDRNAILQRAFEQIRQANSVTAQQDAEYMAAVERADMETAQRMVDEAAQRAGYSEAFKGFREGGGIGMLGSRGGWFSDTEQGARPYGPVTRAFADKSNIWNFRSPDHVNAVVDALGEEFTPNGLGGFGISFRGALARGFYPFVEAMPVLNAIKELGFTGLTTSEGDGRHFSVFSPEQIKSADPITRNDAGSIVPLSRRFDPSSPDIRQSKANKNSDRLVRPFAQLVEAAKKNESWRTWYDTYQAELREMFGSDAEIFRDFLSATSQATGVAGNVTLALKAYRQWINGEPFTGYLDAVAKNLEKAASKIALSGAKISQYQAANLGDTSGIAVDRHIVELLFNRTGSAPNAAQIAKAKEVIGRIASELGWEPRQVQAALWAHNQVRKGSTPQSYDTYIRRKSEEIAALRASADAARAGGGIPARPQPQGSGQPDLRLSRSSGRFFNIVQAEAAIRTAESRGANAQALTSIAQAQGSLIPRTSLDEANRLQFGTRADKLAFTILKPLRKIAELGDRGWLSAFPVANLSATQASEMGEAAELAAEAVVRSDLGLRKTRDSINKRITEKKDQLAEALADIPEALIKKLDAELALSAANNLVREMQAFIANQIKVASTTAPASIRLALTQASRSITERKNNIGSAVGSALTNIANEMPASITTQADMLTWITNRLANTSQPQIMSDIARDFLFTRIKGTRVVPFERIKIADLIENIREVQKEKGVAQIQIAALRAKIGGKGGVTARKFVGEYESLKKQYAAAIKVFREVNSRVEALDNQITALNKAAEVMDRAMQDVGYDLRLKDAIKLINASPSQMKIVYGADGKPTGTITVPNPITRKAVTIDLTPNPVKVKLAVAQLRELLQAHVTAIGDPQTDPYEVEQLIRNVPQLQRLSEGLAPWLLRSMISNKVPFIGGMTVPSLWEMKTKLPWFGSRLSTPNNILGWIGGPLQRTVAGLIEAMDVAELKLEALRSDPNRANPSQERIDETMLKAMQAHGMDPANQEEQLRWTQFINRVISQNQNAESVPFKVGDNTIFGLVVMPEDLAAAEAQKAYSKAVFQIGQKSKKGSIMRNLFERPLLQAEEIAGRVILRASADYGLKMSRTADMENLPIVRNWVKSTSAADKMQLLEDHFTELVLGMVTESNPEFRVAILPSDKAIFAELIGLERSGKIPFTDVEGFLDWWADKRATANSTAVADERAKVENDLLAYVDGMMTKFGEAYSAGKVGEVGLDAMNKRNIAPATIVSALSADNQFTKSRGNLVAPSTFYKYHLAGIGAQEVFKTNLLNHLAAEQLLGWQNLLSAIRVEMNRYDRRKKELMKTMSESKAIRKIQIESRKGARTIANESDYATLRSLVTSLEAMNAELERLATEFIAVPDDMPGIRTTKSILALMSSSLLGATSPMTNNATGAAVMHAAVTSWLRRQSTLTAGPAVIAKMIKYSIGRGLSSVAKRVKWFRDWLSSSSGIGNMLGSVMAEAMRQRANAENALTVNVPDVGTRVRMQAALPGASGYFDPGRSQQAATWFFNMLQAGFGIPYLKKVFPKSLHRYIDAAAKLPLYGTEGLKRVFPGAVDRTSNIVTGQGDRDLINDPGLLKSIADAFDRRAAADPNWRSKPIDLTPEEMDSPASKMKMIRDILGPIAPFERAALDWYDRTKSMTPAERIATPLLTPDQEDQFVLNVLKMTNQRTQSTTPPVMKGKGLTGLMRSIGFMFARYGVNMAGVMARRFAEVQGSDSDRDRWIAGLLLAAVIAMLSVAGLEAKQFFNWIQGEPRNALTMGAALESPTAAGRYMSAAIASQIPWGGDTLQQLFGGTPMTQPFDATRGIPLLGQLTAAYNMARQVVQTGDVGYAAADFLRSSLPASKIVLNTMMPGDVMRREASRAVRLNAPTDIELREFGGAGGRATPMQPLIRAALNASFEGDQKGYQAAVDKAVKYQMSKGKTREEAVKTVNAAVAAKDPIMSVVGRKLSDTDVERITRNMTGSQKRSFLKARTIAAGAKSSGLRSGGRRGGLLRGSARRRSLLRGQRRKKTRSASLLKSL